MGETYLYGELPGSLMFLRECTVRLLHQLWDILRSAQDWDDIRAVVGQDLTGTLILYSGTVAPPNGEPPFDRETLYANVVASWTPVTLSQLMLFDTSLEVVEVATPRSSPRYDLYLTISPGEESRIVLALVHEGHRVKRDDEAIRQCLPIREKACYDELLEHLSDP